MIAHNLESIPTARSRDSCTLGGGWSSTSAVWSRGMTLRSGGDKRDINSGGKAVEDDIQLEDI